jgi:monovalent cation:H+ antiporter-2, CPA2 family
MALEVLKNIVIIFALSTSVNFLFTKIKVPTILGYLLTGIIVGPSLLGVINTHDDIELMAEIGVVMLLFTIGIEFSLNHLLKIRRIVFLGGFLQLILTVMVFMLVSVEYKINWRGALFIGFLSALSSTAVVLKILQERSELTSNYGRTVLGILIFQDLLLVPLLLITPILAGQATFTWQQLFVLLLKVVIIIGLIYAGNRWLMPKVLRAVAMTKNQELFLMSTLLICLSVALLTSALGMSLAVGAFLAGLMVSESGYSHNAFGNIIPFKNVFTSFFFVSIGILLDLDYVIQHPMLVILTALLLITCKALLAGITAFLLGHTFRGVVMVGIALSQVGEFSFILAKLGLDYKIIDTFYYQLFIAVAVISMALTPLLMLVSRPIANVLLRLPLPKKMVEGIFPLPEIDIPELCNHLVFIGKDSRALNLSVMSMQMNLPYVSIVFDPDSVRKRQLKGEKVIYGDAVNEPILLKAHTHKADIVVVSTGNIITTMAIIEKVRTMNPHAYIIVRAKVVEDLEDLYDIGADQVIPEEFETSIEMFDRVLSKLLIPRKEINAVIGKIRDDNYGIFRENNVKTDLAALKMHANIEITAVKIENNSPVIGLSLLDAQLRKTYGVTLVALFRNKVLYDNPDPETVFQNGDIIYIMGRSEQIANASEIFAQSDKHLDNFVDN